MAFVHRCGHSTLVLSERRRDRGVAQLFAEKYFLGLLEETQTLPKPEKYTDSATNGLLFYQRLQLDDGHWACGYGGPSFLTPGLVFAMYITRTAIPPEWKVEMIAYLAHHVREDGGWGMHLLGETTVFATAPYYVMLRFLGVEVFDPLVARARERLLALGGAIGVPQWGKFWLCVLNLYDWEGVNPVPPELWLLPDWVPFHPWRWWVQTRSREEIYTHPYSKIRFRQHSNTVAAADLKLPPSMILNLANPILRIWDAYLRPECLHSKVNQTIRDLMQREDENTSYNNLASVNQALQLTAVYFADGEDSEGVAKHRDKLQIYVWQGAEGMTVSGTDGVQVWDTAFSVLAVVEAGLAQDVRFRPAMAKALKYLDISQLRDDLLDPYREQRKGGWAFSTKGNGFKVSDCSAESMKAVILLQEECGFPKIISDSRLRDCVDSLLIMQNADGGFASYERARAGAWLERLSPAEVFDQIMVEHSYTECTAAVLTSLALFRRHFPDYRASEIEATISRSADYILASQRRDCSWEGAWAICFTYATFFALEGLEMVHQTYQTSEPVRKACDWLVSMQQNDGGWGEHWSSCELRRYVQHEKSQVVNTSWAVLALMAARYPHEAAIERGLQLIKSPQQPNGEWLQEDIEGIFNRTCTIGFPNYKFYFPIRALGKYEHVYRRGSQGILRRDNGAVNDHDG